MTAARLVGARVPRLNDRKFLEGTARYVDDISLPGLLHAAIIRSPVPHGRLLGLSGHPEVTGVELILGPREVRERVKGDVPVVWRLPGQRQGGHPLVDETVRYVGQPVGIVVARSREQAEDAVEQLSVDVDELPTVADVDAALAQDAPLLYPSWGTNVVAEFEVGDTEEFTVAVFAAADRRLRAQFRVGRVAGVPMECRGIVAVPDAATGGLAVWTSTQAPHMVKDMIAAVLGLPHHVIRVVGPDVGGGFGVKDHIYEDELLVCLAALELGLPIKWVEDRRESLMTTAQARSERFDVEVAFDRDGTLRGLRVRGVRDCGAYLSIFGVGPLRTMGDVLPGPYRWEAIRMTGIGVVTNRVPTGAYRGFGQPQATFVRERAVEMVASDLGLDPVDLRLRNMIGPQELPYRTRTGLRYESGDYPRALRRAAELIRSGPTPPADGRVRGVGFSSYVELCAVGPRLGARVLGVDAATYETATVRMEVDGSVRIYVGTSPHGQGHETTFAQLCADRLGVPIESITLVHSDTDVTPYSSYGTAASRSITLGGGAVVRASEALAQKIRRVAAELLEVSPEDVVLSDGRATVAGTDRAVSLADVARAAWRPAFLPPEIEPGLVATSVYDPEDLSFSYATHACQVAVDRDTGMVEVERFVVVHDCGTIVNPTIVEGQIHGGVAQGIGQALLEEAAYSEDAQPIATTFMDYLIPSSAVIPALEVEHMETPSPFTPGGMKGMGEGGTIGAPAAVVNAIAAALPEVSHLLTETPVTPARLWQVSRARLT